MFDNAYYVLYAHCIYPLSHEFLHRYSMHIYKCISTLHFLLSLCVCRLVSMVLEDFALCCVSRRLCWAVHYIKQLYASKIFAPALCQCPVSLWHADSLDSFQTGLCFYDFCLGHRVFPAVVPLRRCLRLVAFACLLMMAVALHSWLLCCTEISGDCCLTRLCFALWSSFVKRLMLVWTSWTDRYVA